MKVIIKGTNLEVTEALKSYAEEKIGHLEHYSDEILEARVELETSTHHQSGFFRCEVNLDMPEMQVLRAESTEPDLYAAIDAVIPKLREQIEKHKAKHRSRDREMRRYLKTVFAWLSWRKRR